MSLMHASLKHARGSCMHVRGAFGILAALRSATMLASCQQGHHSFTYTAGHFEMPKRFVHKIEAALWSSSRSD